MAQVSHRRACRRELLDLQFCAHCGCTSPAGARPFCLWQQRISRSCGNVDPAGRKPGAGAGIRTAWPRHRRAVPCCGPRCSRRICLNGSRSTLRCFRAASMSFWWPTMRLSPYLAPRGLPRREIEACMWPSREASAPSRTPTVCWRTSAAAIATFPNSRSRRYPNSSASASIGS